MTTGAFYTVAWWTCRCGKRGFPSRRSARHNLRAAHPDDRHRMQVYRCPAVPGSTWHYGHPRGHERQQDRAG